MGLSPSAWEASALAAFSAFWAGRTPVALPNLPFDPASAVGDAVDGAYVEVEVRQPAEGEASVGRSGYLLRSGIFAVAVRVRANAGKARALELADDVLRWLRAAGVAETVFRRRGLEEVGSDGAWFQVNVSAGFLYVSDTRP